jgi:superfamily I DNA/RNA helicase
MGSNWIVQNDAERDQYVAEAVNEVRTRTNGRASALFERPLRFFSDELRYIAQYGLDDDAYLKAERTGRGVGLARALRPTLLEVRQAYMRARTAAHRRYDWDDVAGAVVDELAIDTSPRLYRHVVIDEGQDFSPQMLRSLARAVPADGSLTFFGDMAQQIYGRQVSWRQSGLHIPHGTWEFRRNYRNTPEIAELGLAIADMDFFRDVPDMVRPDEFEPSGPMPSLVRCASVADETRWVIEAAKDAARVGSVGVLMRRHEDEARFNRAFRGGQYLNKYMGIWDPGPGISWGTVHAAKGFEFDTVFLVGMSDDAWPEPEAVAADGEQAARSSDGSLLYVGVTRARGQLNMSFVGEPTRLLPSQPGLWEERSV